MAPKARGTPAPKSHTPARVTRSRKQAPQEVSQSPEAPEIPQGLSTSYGSPGAVGAPTEPPHDSAPSPDIDSAIRDALRSTKKNAPLKAPIFGAGSESAESDYSPQPVRAQGGFKSVFGTSGQAQPAAKSLFAQPANGGLFTTNRPPSSLIHEGTAIEPVSHYNHLPPAFAARSTKRRPGTHSSSNGTRTASRPWDVTVLYHSIPRYIKNTANTAFRLATSRWATLLILFCLLFSVVGHVPDNKLPISVVRGKGRLERGVRVIMGMEEFEKMPSRFEQAWHWFRFQYKLTHPDMPEFNLPDMQWAYNIQFLTRIENLEERNQKLQEAVDSLTKQIREDLPRITVVQVEDNEFIIPDGFWMALHGKMTGDSTLWDAFHKANEQQLEEYTRQVVDDRLALGEKRSTVVGKEALEDIIRANYDSFLKEFRDTMDEQHDKIIVEVRKVASEVAADLIARHTAGKIAPSQRAQNLAAADYLTNSLDELHSVNYFSPYHGAQVDYRLTSPTALRKQPTWLAQWYASWGQQPNKPHTALRAWSEVTESWCAAKSDSPGKAQLAVNTKQMITPHELIVEHIPASGTLEIANAPRELEMWMHVGTEEVAANVENAIREEVPGYDRPQCGESPGPGFVCAVQGSYDIHQDNWVQSLPALRLLDSYKIKSQRFIIRSLSNWGGDHTCFYRLRLKGAQ